MLREATYERERPTELSQPQCPCCESAVFTLFYSAHDVPAHSCVVLDSREEAVAFNRADVDLAVCERCGFIWNASFDRTVIDYTEDYEETQGFSPRFISFLTNLARHLIDRYQIHGKTVLELGCGKGEFLALLCEMGSNNGIGIDPSWVPGRTGDLSVQRISFMRDFFDERYTGLEADLICCRHTLEHIPDVAHFVGLTKLAADNVAGSAVCFEIPEMMRILREGAFWDIFHEHCSYFTPGSLGRVFRSVGFEITGLSVDYDDQYLLIEATPSLNGSEAHPLEETVTELKGAIEHFQSVVSSRIDHWRTTLAQAKANGRRAVVWGSGSKAVAFLNAVGIEDAIEYVVDINPYRQGKFMPGTSQQIVNPELLKDYRPDLVVLMNPIYEREVRAQLEGMGLAPEIVAV